MIGAAIALLLAQAPLAADTIDVASMPRSYAHRV